MNIVPSRLRTGEVIVGASAVVLLVFMFALPWYGVSAAGVTNNLDGWQSLNHLRWLLVVTIVAAFALVYFQAERRAPAVPVTLSVIDTVLAFVTVLALVYRVLINVPGSDSTVDAKVGAYLGLVATLGILCGAFTSLRQEGISPRDAPPEIETVRLGEASGS